MKIAFPGESAEYRAARDQLLEREIELRRALEAVALARRELPPGGVVPKDYVFAGPGEGGDASGATREVKLSQLFTRGRDTLVVYNFMFGPDRERPCPMCTSTLDGVEGVAEHIDQQVDLVVVAKSPLARILAFARERGWTRLRLLSSAGNTYNRDYLGEKDGGEQQEPMWNVFKKGDDGQTRHCWGSEMLYAPTETGQDPRHGDLLSPLWNLLDLTPRGRAPEWYTKLSYP